MSRRLVVLATTLALLCSAFAPTVLARKPAGPVGQDRFQHVNVKGNPDFTPAMADQSKKLVVAVEMSGKPLATRMAEAKANGKSLTRAQQQAIVRDLKAAQASTISRAKALGATIRETYQSAVYGFSVRIARGQLGALSQLPGVLSVTAVGISTPDNERSVPFIGAPIAWDEPFGLTGDGVKIGIIDTGIDYYHANFGGSGDPADFANADGLGTDGVFPTAKVAGGYDFVGDAYNADLGTVPQPDSDPLDCYGHGSHVAGTAAGYGVLSDGSTYTGSYDATTVSSHDWNIGPGVAPEATLYAYRVFGCEGTVENDIVVAAIDRAVSDGMDVINMSLGSPYGSADGIEQTAITNAAAAGTLAVTSAGNEGTNAYMVGAPSTSDYALSVAAIDGGFSTYPAADFSNPAITALNANDATFSDGTTLQIQVLRDSGGGISLGCDPQEYIDQNVAGHLVVTQRGTCARVARAIFGEQAGAAAVVMINSSNTYPPYEGPITNNPDTGEQYNVTIPFLGALSSDGPALEAADGQDTTLTNTTTANPGYKHIASFSSGGPRNGDSALKPDVAAPGVSTVSTAIGTGDQGAAESGTSMAAPHATGTAALVKQAHPTWTATAIKAAIMDTASTDGSVLQPSYNDRLVGTGVIQPAKAVHTPVYAMTGAGQFSLNYGYEALDAAYDETKTITFYNPDSSSHAYDLTAVGPSCGQATFDLSASSVTVPAGGSASVDATVHISAANAANLLEADTFAAGPGAVATCRMSVEAAAQDAGLPNLRVAGILVPRGLSDVSAGAPDPYTLFPGYRAAGTTSHLTNNGIHAGNADVYAWGATDPADSPDGAIDIRNVGVQSLPGEYGGGAASDRLLVFAINVDGSWSNAATSEFDIAIDLNGDHKTDYYVVGLDLGILLAGDWNGQMASFIFKVNKNGSQSLVDAWYADAPMNGSTLELPTLASEIGLSGSMSNTKFTYQVVSYQIFSDPGTLFDVSPVAQFDSHRPPVSTGDFIALDPGDQADLALYADIGRANTVKVLGWMVVTLDDANGTAQADTIPLGNLPNH